MHSLLTPEEICSFQQERGLNVTGILDVATERALEDARWKLGDRSLYLQSSSLMHGDDVASLQLRLTEMGFNCGRVDGIYGLRTESAIKEFQKSVGAKVDGRCGPETIVGLIRLIKIVSGGAPTQLRESANVRTRGPALANKVIVLDPGNNLGEEEVVYDIAVRIEGRLLALGASVFLTRGQKNSPSENERITFSNMNPTDLFISLHTERSENPLANGVATYFYGNDAHGVHSVIGERFASLLQREITARTSLLNCRTHPKTWDLLRLTQAPSVRVDCGYLSNSNDAKNLATPEFRDAIAESFIIAIQRLYLAAEDDAKTGTLRLSDLRSAGLRH